MPGAQLLLCDDCKTHEPRHILIIAARSKGAGAVKEYIGKRRYHGEDILADEVLV